MVCHKTLFRHARSRDSPAAAQGPARLYTTGLVSRPEVQSLRPQGGVGPGASPGAPAAVVSSRPPARPPSSGCPAPAHPTWAGQHP